MYILFGGDKRVLCGIFRLSGTPELRHQLDTRLLSLDWGLLKQCVVCVCMYVCVHGVYGIVCMCMCMYVYGIVCMCMYVVYGIVCMYVCVLCVCM